MLLTGVQETQEQSSTSTQREALSSVTNRFELQEVLWVNYIYTNYNKKLMP